MKDGCKKYFEHTLAKQSLMFYAVFMRTELSILAVKHQFHAMALQ